MVYGPETKTVLNSSKIYKGVNVLKILVTGVGGGAGQSVLKALRMAEFQDVLAFDSSPLAAGFYFGYPGVVGFEALHPNYIDHLLKTAIENQVEVIFPGHDIELKVLSKVIGEFLNNGIQILVSDSRVIDICDDKLKTAQFLESAGFDYPRTQTFHDFKWEGHPVVLKPQFEGARSKDTYVAKDFDQFERFSSFVNPQNCVVQEYVEGDEYTCGSIFMDNTLLGVISMKRFLRNGDTYKAFSVKSDPINEFVSKVVTELKPFGACNVQLRIRDGKPIVFEINPRCSGTTAARALVGFNEPSVILNYLKLKEFQEIHYEEATILRYWQEVKVANSAILHPPYYETPQLS